MRGPAPALVTNVPIRNVLIPPKRERGRERDCECKNEMSAWGSMREPQDQGEHGDDDDNA